MAEPEPRQQREVMVFQGFRRRVAASLGERIVAVGTEEMGVAVPAARAGAPGAPGPLPRAPPPSGECRAPRTTTRGRLNAGVTPGGSGISWAFNVIATIV